jgi:multidrug efflux pump
MTVKMAQGWDRLKAGAFAYASTAFPMLTGTGVTIAGFIPVGFARSSAGEYTNALFWVVLTSLLLSWIVAVLFTPYLGYYLLPRKNPADGHREIYDTRTYRRLRSFITLCVRGRWTTVGVTAAAFIAAMIGFGHVPRQFFPSSSRLELLVDIRLAAGASFDATAAEVTKMEKLLAADDRVEDWVAYTGVGSPRFFLTFDQQLQNANFGQFVVRAKGTAERDAIARDIMQRAASEFPAANIRTGRLELGPPVGYPVQFRVSGGDPAKLREIAYQVRDVMHADPNLINVNLDWDELAKRVRVELDHTKAHALGINKEFLECALQVLLGGNVSTQYRDGTDLVDVVLRAPAGERLALKTWGELNIPIPSAHGGWVPLSQIAKVHYELEEPILWRRSRQTVMTVRADITGNAQAPTVSQRIEQELAPLRLSLPDGYRIDVGGAAEASAKGNTSVINALPLMVLVTVGMLMAQLQSFRCLLLVLLTAPLGMIGVTAALLLTGRPFGFVATLGTLALTGIIMRNSVILIDQIEQDIAAGMPRWEAIIDATVRRARPICLTAAAAILAMVPLASSAFWGPMAIAIAGGLAGATLLTLFFLPALYAVFHGVSAPSRRTRPVELPEAVLPAAAE